MHLIDALACGLQGAGNGYAELYQRGTSTRATWYSSFDASGANSSGANITLDSYGGAVVYVNEHVDVVVKASDGATIRSFTSSPGAPAVEVISRSFTGVDYTTGVSGASKPVDLGTLLDRWLTSAGTLDFNVMAGGVARTLQSLATLFGQVFVVTDDRYGATGDGTTDDTASIQSCLTAAGVTGGIVFFPPGSYKITDTLDVPNDVALFGVGSGVSQIHVYHATAGALAYATSSIFMQVIVGLYILPMQANTGSIIDQGAGVKLLVSDCALGSSSDSNGDLIAVANSATCELCVENSRLQHAGATSKFVTSAHVTARVFFRRNTCTANNANWAAAPAFDAAWIWVEACVLTNSSVAAHTWFSRGATTIGYLIDCVLTSGAGGGTIEITSNTAIWYDRGLLTTGISLTANVNYAAGGGRMLSEFRDYRVFQDTAGAAPGSVTVNATEYGMAVVQCNGTGAVVININKGMKSGQRFLLVLVNESGGVFNFTVESDLQQGATFRAASTVANGDWRTVDFVMVTQVGPTWMQVGDVTAAGVNPA